MNMLGVRHLNQNVDKYVDPQFLPRKCVGVEEHCYSIIPDSTKAMIEGAALMNYILQDVASNNGSKVKLADIASRYINAHNSMPGIHPKPSHIWRMGQSIYRARVSKSMTERRLNGRTNARFNQSTSTNNIIRRSYSSVVAARPTDVPSLPKQSLNVAENKSAHLPVQPQSRLHDSPHGSAIPNTQDVNPLQTMMSNHFSALAPWFAMQIMTQPWSSKGSTP
jgi:hypothetical protein